MSAVSLIGCHLNRMLVPRDRLLQSKELHLNSDDQFTEIDGTLVSKLLNQSLADLHPFLRRDLDKMQCISNAVILKEDFDIVFVIQRLNVPSAYIILLVRVDISYGKNVRGQL